MSGPLLKRIDFQGIGRVRALQCNEGAQCSEFIDSDTESRAPFIDIRKDIRYLAPKRQAVSASLDRSNFRITSTAPVEVLVRRTVDHQEVSQMTKRIIQGLPSDESEARR